MEATAIEVHTRTLMHSRRVTACCRLRHPATWRIPALSPTLSMADSMSAMLSHCHTARMVSKVTPFDQAIELSGTITYPAYQSLPHISVWVPAL